jgi:PAS domain S-box-containing protein
MRIKDSNPPAQKPRQADHDSHLPPKALFAGQSVLEQLFANQPDTAFAIKDIKGRYVAVNQLTLDRYGMSEKSQLLGKHVSDIFPEDLSRVFGAQDEAVLRSGKEIINHLELDWYSVGRSGWCLLTKLPVRDESGAIIGLVGTSRVLSALGDDESIPAGLAGTLEYLEAHFDEPLSPKTLADQCGVPQARFARIIKRIFRLTPSQLITQTRIAAASRLLRETDLTISDIAQASGFYDHSALIRAFRSATGFLPSQLRGIEKSLSPAAR